MNRLAVKHSTCRSLLNSKYSYRLNVTAKNVAHFSVPCSSQQNRLTLCSSYHYDVPRNCCLPRTILSVKHCNSLIHCCSLKTVLVPIRSLCSEADFDARSAENERDSSSHPRGRLKATRDKMSELHGIELTHGSQRVGLKLLDSEHINGSESTSYTVHDTDGEMTSADESQHPLSTDAIPQKFKFLRNKDYADYEYEHNIQYGFMRIDSQNLPQDKRRKRTAIPKENSRVSEESKKVSTPHKDNLTQEEMHFRDFIEVADSHFQKKNMNLFDEQYFGSLNEMDTVQITPEKDAPSTENNFFDEQYFGDVATGGSGHHGKQLEDVVSRYDNMQSSPAVDVVKEAIPESLPWMKVPTSQESPGKPDVYEKDEYSSCSQQKKNETVSHSPAAEVKFSHSAGKGKVPKESNYTSKKHEYELEKQSEKELSNVSNVHSNAKPEHLNEAFKSQQDKFSDQRATSSKTLASEAVINNEGSVGNKELNPDNAIFASDIEKTKSRIAANIENPKTAFDLAMKIRLEKKGQIHDKPVSPTLSHKWQGKVDSHGHRILSDQVVKVQMLTENDVLRILHDSVLYEDDNLIAINKPYGLPSHGGPGVHHSVGKFNEPLAQRLSQGRLENLHLVHRLDKETTGVMVLAKSLDVANRIRDKFKKREVLKKYLVITKGIPNPSEGIIDIPLVERSIGRAYVMRLAPEYSDDTRLVMKKTAGEKSSPATTFYRVLDSGSNAALVECQPESGLKHQIRCHLAFGLNCPVLGDHKYSHLSKLAPQKLHPEMLQRLGVRQSKVRHIPMHLHASALVIPEFFNGRNLFLSARLPSHFLQNMKWLKLQMPS